MDIVTKRVTLQSSATATGNGSSIAVTGYDHVQVNITGLTSATITFEVTEDETNWYSAYAIKIGSLSAATTATANGLYLVNVAGMVKMRARISAYTSGTIVATGRAMKGDAMKINFMAFLQGLASTTDSITSKLATDAIMNDTTALTPKFAVISASSSGNTSVVALVSSKKIRVLAYAFQCNAAVNVKFQSNTTDKTGLFYNAANTGALAGFNPVGWFETAAGEALNINLSGAVAVGGHITYIEV